MTFELKVKAMFEGLRRLVCVHGEWVEGGGWGDLGGCSFCVYVCVFVCMHTVCVFVYVCVCVFMYSMSMHECVCVCV